MEKIKALCLETNYPAEMLVQDFELGSLYDANSEHAQGMLDFLNELEPEK